MRTNRGRYTCYECKAMVVRSDFLIETGHTFEGGLEGKCWQCNKTKYLRRHPTLTEEKVKKIYENEVRAMHATRTDIASRTAVRARCGRFEDMIREVEAERPGVTYREARQQVVAFLREASQAIVRDFAECGLLGKLAEIYQCYEKVTQLAANTAAGADSSPGITIPGGSLLRGGKDGHLLQFMHKLSPGGEVQRYYVCRRVGCGFYATNTSWATTYPEGWVFSCSACGHQYRAGPNTVDTIPARMLFNVNGRTFATMWPPSEEEDFFLKVAESSSARLVSHITEMGDEMLLTEFVTLSDVYAGKPPQMQWMTLDPKIRAWWDSENTKRRKVWHYEHLFPRFPGAFYHWDPPRTTCLSIEDTQRFVAMIGETIRRGLSRL